MLRRIWLIPITISFLRLDCAGVTTMITDKTLRVCRHKVSSCEYRQRQSCKAFTGLSTKVKYKNIKI